MKIYLDTNFFIGFIEDENEILKKFYKDAAIREEELFTSELTLLETLTGAIRDDDEGEIAAYEGWLGEVNQMLKVLPISREVLRKAAAVRVTLGNKTPDAIHVATAELADCEVFVSSDRKLRVPQDMRKVGLEDLGTLL